MCEASRDADLCGDFIAQLSDRLSSYSLGVGNNSKFFISPEDVQDEEECRPWWKRLSLSIMAVKFNWVSCFKITLLVILIVAIAMACYTLPIEKILKNFLRWVEKDLGPWVLGGTRKMKLLGRS